MKRAFRRIEERLPSHQGNALFELKKLFPNLLPLGAPPLGGGWEGLFHSERGWGVRLLLFPLERLGEALLLDICLLKTILLLLINDDKNERNNDGCNATRGEERFHGEVAWVVLIE